MRLLLLLLLFIVSCDSTKRMQLPERKLSLTGNDFYQKAFAMKWAARDSFAVKEVLSGNVPDFLKKFVAIDVSLTDSSLRKTIKATYYVSPDYLSIGSNNDWARINITPIAAQKIADSLDCF